MPLHSLQKPLIPAKIHCRKKCGFQSPPQLNLKHIPPPPTKEREREKERGGEEASYTQDAGTNGCRSSCSVVIETVQSK